MSIYPPCPSFFFFFNDTATTEIYTLSLHDALPISPSNSKSHRMPTLQTYLFLAPVQFVQLMATVRSFVLLLVTLRSEEHTSELQSRPHLVCRLLLEKKQQLSKTAEPVVLDVCPTWC